MVTSIAMSSRSQSKQAILPMQENKTGNAVQLATNLPQLKQAWSVVLALV